MDVFSIINARDKRGGGNRAAAEIRTLLKRADLTPLISVIMLEARGLSVPTEGPRWSVRFFKIKIDTVDEGPIKTMGVWMGKDKERLTLQVHGRRVARGHRRGLRVPTAAEQTPPPGRHEDVAR